ncbi:unannotated protein [freshwater metagenome]|uniref:Unannotated protein n=1 Tax=freshwater metagenome TaxID=449393 RepID=A0A6J7RKQ6_9ZZZZ|nr:DUF3710 domain-containing protein [Actinomycetota bacterium]MSW10999.1 DUF3710 domain-containing protein [Actinomycetota bacterium]MSY17530.1 DUF3710 domain-containing protein [Actinomycetota bacterium]MSY98076.1 DUF3710 domain-containing protein [Actinomycetota bacterium]
MSSREFGPWDEAEIDFSDGIERLDLGGLLVKSTPGVDVQVQADEATGAVTQLTFAQPGAAVQVQPYAAPKSGGMWQDVRGQIKSSITKGGGLVEEVNGSFGLELQTQITGDDGKMQPARFTGIDGTRWFLRAVFLGAAAKPGPEAATLEALVRELVVVRGGDAMPVGSPIPLKLPNSPTSNSASSVLPDGRPILAPFVRGPELTETR